MKVSYATRFQWSLLVSGTIWMASLDFCGATARAASISGTEGVDSKSDLEEMARLCIRSGRSDLLNQKLRDAVLSNQLCLWRLAHARNLLDSCTPGSILFTESVADSLAIWTLQITGELRSDVAAVPIELLGEPWFLVSLADPQPSLPGYPSRWIPYSRVFEWSRGPRSIVSLLDVMSRTEHGKRPVFIDALSDTVRLIDPERLVLRGLTFEFDGPEAEEKVDWKVISRLFEDPSRIAAIGDAWKPGADAAIRRVYDHYTWLGDTLLGRYATFEDRTAYNRLALRLEAGLWRGSRVLSSP